MSTGVWGGGGTSRGGGWGGTRLSNPFVEKGRAQQQEAPTKLGSVPQPPPPAEAARAAAEAAKPAKGADETKAAKAASKGDRPRFEFYQILPGDKEAPDKAPPKAAV